VGDDHGAGFGEQTVEVFDDSRFLGFVHLLLLSTGVRDDPRAAL
jgi:hypothetical protein